GDAPTYHFAFRVPGDRFHEAKEWLSGRVDLLQEDGVNEFDWDFWDAHAVYAEDPARNVIELIAFAGLDEGGGAAFSGASILALAELGLPVADPRVAVASLAENVRHRAVGPSRGHTGSIEPSRRAWGDVTRRSNR